MFHSSTERLIGYWRSLAAPGAVPLRADFQPAEVAQLLPRVFMLGRTAEGWSFRLAGDLLWDLHGRELRGTGFLSLWSPASRAMVQRAMLDAVHAGEAAVVAAEARNADGGGASLEIALAPLRGVEGRTDRLLGLYQPTSPLVRLDRRPVVELSARLAAPAAPDGRASRLKLAALDGRRIA